MFFKIGKAFGDTYHKEDHILGSWFRVRGLGVCIKGAYVWNSPVHISCCKRGSLVYKEGPAVAF